jgi:hypothetical protein
LRHFFAILAVEKLSNAEVGYAKLAERPAPEVAVLQEI